MDPCTKERLDKGYGITNDEGSQRIQNEERNVFSVGDDLEAFTEENNNGEIIETDFKVSYLFRLMDKEEQRKLDRKDASFFKTFYGWHMIPKCRLNSGIKSGYTESVFFCSVEFTITLIPK